MAKKDPAVIKRDTRKNWEKANYVPKENVIVVMDNDDGSISLMVGDGKTNVNNLPDLLKDKISGAKASVVNDDILIL